MLPNSYKFIAPEYAALINPTACTAFAMRCEGRSDVKQANSVDTGVTPDGTPISAVILDTTTESAVCDAKMFVAPLVELYTDVSLAYASVFVTSLLSFSIDGEPVVNQSAVNNHLLCPACLIGSRPTAALTVLLGCDCELGLLGMCQMFFLPNGTKMTATLSNIPTGGGVLRINAGIILVDYTTKVRQGCLFGVGALDVEGQAFPVQYPCNATFGVSPAGAPSATAAVSGPGAGPTFGPAAV